MKNSVFRFLFALLAGSGVLGLSAQTAPIATLGTDFWVGFMQNAYAANSLELRIAAQGAVTGTVSMPLAGWSYPFSIPTNSIVTVPVPTNAENIGSETILDKGVRVQASGNVTVTAVSLQNFTTDGAQVFPVATLGTSYRAQGYRGLPGFVDFYKSELLIVATQNGTEVTIVPSVLTSGGHPANIPFNVSLNAGETYQVQGALASLDITGTSVTGTAASGSCRPFAVFSGSMCANVPVGCPACDHIYEQMLPTTSWGNAFHSFLFGNTTQHTYRVLANSAGTQVSINGAAPIALGAGGTHEVNANGAPVCITSTAPVSVVLLMEGFNCANKGDPAMVELMDDQRKSTFVRYSTPTSAQLTYHSVSVVMETADIGQLLLDGSSVPVASFSTYPGCAGWSVVTAQVPAGSHTLAATDGFLAYASGTGTGESYAFGLSNTATAPPPPPTVLCTNDPVTLDPGLTVLNAEWTMAGAPNTILATTPTYSFTPGLNGTYVLDAELPVSACPVHREWIIGVEIDPDMTLTADGAGSGDLCQFEATQLNVTPAPNPAAFNLSWTPASALNNPGIPNPLAYPITDTWFKLSVESPVGCGSFADSIFVDVDPSDILGVRATASDSAICSGETISLVAKAERVLHLDRFESALAPFWASVQGGALSSTCGAVSGTALRFDATGTRSATTSALNLNNGANLRVAVRIAAGTAPCDDAEPGDDVHVEYSLDGTNWTTITTLHEAAYPDWTPVIIPLPTGAQSGNTRLRFRQLANSGAGTDVWALDDVIITHYDDTDINFSWAPAATVANPSQPSTTSSPTVNTTFSVTAQNANGCGFTTSVPVTVAVPFNITASNDTTLCMAGTPRQLWATTSSGTGITWSWTPNNGSLNNASIANPVATATSTSTYIVTATSNIGCTDQEPVVITVGQLQSVDVTATNVQLCQTEQTQLTAIVVGAQPYSLSWTPNNGTLSSLTAPTTTASPTATTTYTATATETASGCQVSDAIIINMAPVYQVQLGPDQSMCTTLGHQLNAASNVPSPTYVWTNGALLNDNDIQSPTIMFDTTATYAVTVFDALGCSTTDSVTITDPFDLLITPINLNACIGEVVVLNAQFPGCVYDWNTEETSQTIQVTVSGMYVCTITDALGCQAIKTYYVNFHAMPVVELGPDTAICGGTSLTLDAGNPGSTILWSTTDPAQSITVTTSDTYSVLVTTPQGCQDHDTISVQFNALPLDMLQDVTTCTAAPPILDAGNPGCAYEWNTEATTQSIVADTAGTYAVTVTTPLGCSATFQSVVNLMPEVLVDLGPDTVLCSGQPITLDAGHPGHSFMWTTSAQTQTIAPTTSNIYGVTVSNGYCTGSDSILVTFMPLPVDALQDETVCIDASVRLDAQNPGCTYVWSTEAETSFIVVDQPGLYEVVVTNPSGCSATFDALVTMVPYPVVDLGPDTVLCSGDLLDLDAGNPDAAFHWNTGQFSQVITVGVTGSFAVAVDNGYCTSHDTINAVFNPRPDPMPGHEYFACLVDDPHYVLISAGNDGGSYTWDNGGTQQVILAASYGWYYVDITNGFDCTRRDSAEVREFCPPSMYVPNTFTPNGDGLNDIWLVSGKNIGAYDMNVFDRWGNIIFHSDAVEHGWDGTINGVPAPNEVYVWRMEYKFIEKVDGDEGVNHQQMGHITIMR